MTLNEMVFEIAEKTSKPHDIAVINQIKRAIITWRSFLLRQMGHKRYLSATFIQDFCVDTELVDSAECCNTTSNCKVRRSKLPVPRPVDFRDWDYSYIGRLDNNQAFGLAEPSELDYILTQPFANLHPRYWKIGDYLYNNSQYKKMRVRGIFEDPRDVYPFKDCNGVICYTDDTEFPLTEEMFGRIKISIIQNELSGIAITKNEELPLKDTNANG